MTVSDDVAEEVEAAELRVPTKQEDDSLCNTDVKGAEVQDAEDVKNILQEVAAGADAEVQEDEDVQDLLQEVAAAADAEDGEGQTVRLPLNLAALRALDGECSDQPRFFGLPPPGFEPEDAVDRAEEPAEERPWTPCSTPSIIFRGAPPRKMSDETFSNKDQTLIIFDWDDTLCPTSACFETHGMVAAEKPPEGSDLAVALARLAVAVEAVLVQAADHAGTYAIVTNGGEQWVDLSAAAWIPAVVPMLKPNWVSSARSRWENHPGVTSPTGWKAKEFEEVIDRFYSRYDNQSWKNIICVGDAPYEHDALRRVVDRNWCERGLHCRTKFLKFKTKPSIDELVYQLSSLASFLPGFVSHDGDLDIDFAIPLHLERAVPE